MPPQAHAARARGVEGGEGKGGTKKSQHENMSSYIHDAGGDRSLKLTGANQQMLINNQYYINFANLNENKSLYMGAYMVLTNSNYTKHYYIEGERVSTKIGGGFSVCTGALCNTHNTIAEWQQLCKHCSATAGPHTR